MDYYRRYVADYLSKTVSLSMAEDGAYGRMLDWYYANEKPLPPDLDRVFAITRARTPAEKKAVAAVLHEHFELRRDGYHNRRADSELGVAVPKIEKMREVARENGKKGGRKPGTKIGTEIGSDKEPKLEPGSVSENNPDRLRHAHLKQPPTASLYPSSKPETETTPATSTGTTGDRQPAAGAPPPDGVRQPPGPAVVAHVEALRVGIPAGTDAHEHAAMLWATLHANGCKGTASHPAVVEMARQGVTVDDLKRAIVEARKTTDGTLNPAYLAAIVERLRTEKPANGRAQAWATDEGACEAKARELGLWPAKAGEDWNGLRGRIRAKLSQRAEDGVR